MSKPTLILSQASWLSTFVSYRILTDYKGENISLIDVGKPLQTLFTPEITAGGMWRDANNLKTSFDSLHHLISDQLCLELKIDTKIETGTGYTHNSDMDIEDLSRSQNTLF